MKIRMNTLSAGPDKVMQPGQVYDVSDEEGKDLVFGGYAVVVDDASVKVDQVDDGPLSLEAFGELKAEEQKALLSELQIQGDDGNAEKRSALYAAYLEASK